MIQVALFDVPDPPPGVDRARQIAHRAATAIRRQRTAARKDKLRAAAAGPRSSQWSPQLPMPATILECRGGPGSSVVAEFIADFGACPVLRCRHNLALWVRENGSIKVEGGHVKGGTLRHNRRATAAKVDRLAELVVELADRLGTLCVLDLLPASAEAAGYDDRRPYMSHEQIGRVLAQSKESARKIVDDADESADIAQAKLRRHQKRDRQALAAEVEQAAQAKRDRIRAGRDQLVQIRRRPA